MGKEALSIDANTFQFFSRNPRGSKAKAIDPEDVRRLRELMKENDFGPVIAHAPYTLNAASAEPRIRQFAAMVMEEDLKALQHLPGNYYNFHPGSHVGQGSREGIRRISGLLDTILRQEYDTTVLLETMAGKGTEIGRSFQELKEILDAAEAGEKLGICLDTCHISDAGYDVAEKLEEVVFEFDRIIGLNRLRAVHLNDSMNPVGSRKDRHAKLGEGAIGFEALCAVITHPGLRHLPFCLETPNDLAGYKEEIRRLREAAGE